MLVKNNLLVIRMDVPGLTQWGSSWPRERVCGRGRIRKNCGNLWKNQSRVPPGPRAAGSLRRVWSVDHGGNLLASAPFEDFRTMGAWRREEAAIGVRSRKVQLPYFLEGVPQYQRSFWPHLSRPEEMKLRSHLKRR